jgi:SAM-dependent methyltransferase
MASTANSGSITDGGLITPAWIEQSSGPVLERTQTDSTVAVQLALQWQSKLARHTDCVYAAGLNLWRDFFPEQFTTTLLDRVAGEQVAGDFSSGQLVPQHRVGDYLRVPQDAFKRTFANQRLMPRAGRFYPRAIIAGVHGITAQDMSPLRVCEVDDQLSVDLNHPLSEKNLRLTTTLLDVSAGSRRGGACREVAEMITGSGPGMQGRWDDRPTDFWSDQPFDRTDNAPDADFYARPRFVDHVDCTASAQIAGLYRRLIPKGATVLDLMSSWQSHLDTGIELTDLVGLGLNAAELQANPRLTGCCVADLNQSALLPFDNDTFGVVVCSLSVEYLTQPLAVFEEVRRVLKTGGCFVLTFSNRWFPPKAIAIWGQLHEFERPGLILEYFDSCGGFSSLETWSVRHLPRPDGDKYSGKLRYSDPVHAVWGIKS